MGLNSPTGLSSRAYINTGTVASKTWTRLKRFNKIGFEINGEEVALELNESQWKRILAGLDEFVITGTYAKLKGASDALFTKLMTSKLDKTPVEIGVLDGDVTDADSYGFQGPMLVTQLKRNGELNSAILYDFTAKLTELYNTSTLVEPDEFTGSGS